MGVKLPITIRTVDLKTGGTKSEMLMDFNDTEKRVWLLKHLYWAFNNQHGVQLLTVKDESLETDLANR